MNRPRLPEGFDLIACTQVDSTNEEAKRRAAAGAPHATVIWAQEQSAGRGRRGRTWVSETGNLYCSFLLRPDCTLAEAAQLSFVAALGAAGALESLMDDPARVRCKWPNDVLIDGYKVAGILLETTLGADNALDAVIAGIGVNVASHPEATDHPAMNLRAAGAMPVGVEGVFEALGRDFAKWHDTWREKGFAPVREAWLKRAFGRGEPITVRLASESLSGVFEGLDPQGALILAENSNRRYITAGDVFFDTALMNPAS